MSAHFRRWLLIATVLLTPFAFVLAGSFFFEPILDAVEGKPLAVRMAVLGTLSVVYAPEFLSAEAVERYQPADIWNATIPTPAGQSWRSALALTFRFVQGGTFVLLLPYLIFLLRLGSRVPVAGRPLAVFVYGGTAFVLAGLLITGGYLAFCSIAESSSIASEIASH